MKKWSLVVVLVMITGWSFVAYGAKGGNSSLEKIVFLRTMGVEGSYYSEIWLIDRNGANRHQIYTHKSHINLATWSQDNKDIYFYDNKGIWRFNLSKKTSKFLHGFPLKMPPILNCSADAEVCVFIDEPERSDIKRIRVCGKNEELLITGVEMPSFSYCKPRLSDKEFLVRFANNMTRETVKICKIKIDKNWACISFFRKGNQYYNRFVFTFLRLNNHFILYSRGWLGDDLENGIWSSGQWTTFFKEHYPPQWVTSFSKDEGGM